MKNTTDKAKFDLLELVEGLLNCLSDKEADIVRRRFGLREGEESAKETLEGIGRAYRITRERVRQIQNQSIGKLKDSVADSGSAEAVSLIEKTVASLIGEHGGIMEEGHLLSELLEGRCEDSKSRKAGVFLMSEILSDDIQKVKQAGGLKPSWKVGSAQMDFYHGVIREMTRIFGKAKNPMAVEELLEAFKKGEFYKNNKSGLSDSAIMSYLKASRAIKRNAFGEWGMAEWHTVTPKRISDKIYLVLKKGGRPMHFTEIADSINEQKFDGKKAHPATVHNELILDKERYVLVGRGIYALSEWGYKPGVISDILAGILKGSKGMSKEALAEQVLRQRIVRKETVYLSLMNRDRFRKTADGKYVLA